MMENAVYSVISPEGCAAILWKDASQKERAARALRLTAQDLHELGIVDEIIPEPEGGAHADAPGAGQALSQALERVARELERLPPDQLLAARAEKFLRMGQVAEG
jgi:acetyl-CoA carboxylase carboxyl transferase subunit alpha